ncbi:MAG: methyltransferase domain-containing protein [Alphaproteobacteria bacterium]|nr:methyltransferase domain-containing protein [Alphaproteobacteria bacterium]
MLNPLRDFVQKHANAEKLLAVRRFAEGLAQDFWKNGSENPFKRGGVSGVQQSAPRSVAPAAPAAASSSVRTGPEWHAAPGELSEKMWGKGFVTPGDEAVTDMLIAPLNLAKEMSVLDLSAGLGGRMRLITEKFGVAVTGLEPDPQIAARGMEMSIMAGKGKHDAIAAYDPANFSVAHSYDCIIARETFYRVADKPAFFKALADAAKAQSQIAFTDYILNPEDRTKPAVKAWMSYEKDASPFSLMEMAESWAKVGFNLTAHDDQTEFYRKEIFAGLKRLAQFLASGVYPDAVTKQALQRRTALWTHRMTAIEQGMKFFRFHGLKKP